MQNYFYFTLLALIVLTTHSASAQAATFHVDPTSGKSAEEGGTGTAANPWRTLEEVYNEGLIETRDWSSLPYQPGASYRVVNSGAPIKAGDTIRLRSGYHGEFVVSGGYNSAPITIVAESGHTPRLSRILFRAAQHWVVRGVSISPSYAPSYSKTTLVDIDNHNFRGPSSDITIENSELFSMQDSSAWTAADWLALAPNAITVDGDRSKILGNTIRNIRFGISVNGESVTVRGNRISNFGGDGLRGLGDYGLFENNIVENAFKIDDNHDDGFQSWSFGPGGVGTGEVRGVVLRGNTFINNRDPNQPLKTPFQGIGCFDGYFVDWIIENNVVIVNHWHGITLMGARNSRIVNNTVIDVYDGTPGPSWIRIAPHKNGSSGTGNIVRNNLASNFANSGPGITEDNNLQVSDPGLHFVDPTTFNFRLKADSSAIDAGSALNAPAFDRDGVSRPQGNAVDLGAFELPGPDTVPPNAPSSLRLH